MGKIKIIEARKLISEAIDETNDSVLIDDLNKAYDILDDIIDKLSR
jgi:hypothetical protein